MPTITIPTSFPELRESEYYTRRLPSSSAILKLSQACNYLWANLRRVHAGHAYEGNGHQHVHLWDGSQDQYATNPNLPGAAKAGTLIASFIVPPNWGASSRLQIDYRFAMNTSSASVGYATFVLCHLDGRSAGRYAQKSRNASGFYEETVFLNIPQDEYYQVMVYVSFDDKSQFLNTVDTDYGFTEGARIWSLSARYAPANSTEIQGDTASAEYLKFWPVSNGPIGGDSPLDAHFLRTVVRNVKHLWGYRSPEVCQTWLAPVVAVNNNVYTECGRYRFYRPSGCTTMQIKVFYNLPAGYFGEIRFRFNGGPDSGLVYSGSLPAQQFNGTYGINEVDLSTGAITLTLPVTTGNVMIGESVLLTIEAICNRPASGAGSGWGMHITGVSAWESAYSPAVFESVTYNPPADYSPIDEDLLRGDEPILEDTITTLFQNIQWLYINRPRQLIGDWRHRCYKRGPIHTVLGNHFDPRSDWTKGPPKTTWDMGRPKNITVGAGHAALSHFFSGYGNYSTGYQSDQGGTSYAAGAPYKWPQGYWETGDGRHGRVLAREWIERIGTLKTHANTLGANFVIFTRARRLEPSTVIDSYGEGPRAHREAYMRTAFLALNWQPSGANDAITNKIPIDHAADWTLQWQTAKFMEHGNSSTSTAPWSGQLRIDGYCPAQKFTNSLVDKEGQLYEVELASVYVADEPLTSDALLALFVP